ncbi:alpha/beta fold hydrolase [Alloyangia pacifica]|uniref:Pimeloyl-ACP methyl ester carboxylesterase n=1 Tax=Alloyangia pacifica TaxID=311180 RepID=A0A1I6U6J4_9RHOB|nr:alpha/beta hydrolase [Alloyangia pacifica]SDH40739.1 Pimeloyl-ACP methyl ester carboxylesterase [Alloyangia pacifica]SFS97159.1 Pimeloyl-ACP methyl ester carboxylesterase [Alloyangia pacifica]
MSYVLGAVAVALPLLAALPGIGELRRRKLDSTRRAEAPGRFARLSQGETHYCLTGPEDGELVVCIHGLTAPSVVFKALARHLAAQGKRVLIYDLYGRGYSDRPRALQTPGFFTRQLHELLSALELRGPVTLLGYSLGATVAVQFAAEMPERVSRLVLLAPAGIESELSPIVDWTAQHRGVGDWLFHMVFPKAHRQNVIESSDARSEVPEVDRIHLAELERRGYVRSVLSSLRGCLQEPQEAQHRRVAGLGIPVLAIWGGQDRMVRSDGMEQLQSWNPSVELRLIEDAWHGVPHTHASEVARIICGDETRREFG